MTSEVKAITSPAKKTLDAPYGNSAIALVPDFKKQVTYVNRAPCDLTIISRNNLPIYLPAGSGNNFQNKYLIIRTTYSFSNKERIINTLNCLDSYEKAIGRLSVELSLIKSLLRQIYSGESTSYNRDIVFERTIDVTCGVKGEGVYLTDEDIVIYRGDYSPTMLHPASEEGKVLSGFKEVLKNRKISGMTIEMVDNDKEYSDKFVYLGNRMISISPQKDTSRESGLYINVLANDAFHNTLLTPDYIPLDKMDTVGIFSSKEEAETRGKPEKLIDIKLKEAEKELLSLKHDNELQKVELDKIKDRRKDYYDQRSFERKDSSEIVKWIPAIISSVLSTCAIVLAIVFGKK